MRHATSRSCRSATAAGSTARAPRSTRSATKTIYLKVKLERANRFRAPSTSTCAIGSTTSVQRARGEPATPPVPGAGHRSAAKPHARSRARSEVPVGTEFDVRLQTALSSGTARRSKIGSKRRRWSIYAQDDGMLVPAGSSMRGVVSSVNKAGRLDRRKGS